MGRELKTFNLIQVATLLLVLMLSLLVRTTSALSREISSVSTWAQQQGIVMHDNLEWIKYDHADNDWGLELKEPVPPGTSLLKVPKGLVLRADCIFDEFVSKHSDGKLKSAVDRLGDYGIHKEVFLIVMKLLRCSKEGDASQWSDWVEALPKTFPVFTDAEKACLPVYAKQAADYQSAKFEAFCKAAEELEGAPIDVEQLKWAFGAVSSRCWKTAVSDTDATGATSTTELVPVGDMFNHREPHNVALTHDEDGSVNFIYRGNGANNDDDKGLYLTYGTSWNPHRFLVMFGFCDTSMPQVWSQLVLPPNNPYSDDPANMVFGAADGNIPQVMWDAVLYELMRSTGVGSLSSDNREAMHAKYKFATTTVIRNQVMQNIQELEELRQRMDDIGSSDNLGLIRLHNEFLTGVYTRVLTQLNSSNDA